MISQLIKKVFVKSMLRSFYFRLGITFFSFSTDLYTMKTQSKNWNVHVVILKTSLIKRNGEMNKKYGYESEILNFLHN